MFILCILGFKFWSWIGDDGVGGDGGGGFRYYTVKKQKRRMRTDGVKISTISTTPCSKHERANLKEGRCWMMMLGDAQAVLIWVGCKSL
jgi:hypothetical protein